VVCSGEILPCEGRESLAQGAQSSCAAPGALEGAWSSLGQRKVSLPWPGWHWMDLKAPSKPMHSSHLVTSRPELRFAASSEAPPRTTVTQEPPELQLSQSCLAMDLVMRLVRALLLLALLLAVAPSPGAAKELCPEPCRCPGRGQLNCGHAGLATVPPGSRRRALSVLALQLPLLGSLCLQSPPGTPGALPGQRQGGGDARLGTLCLLQAKPASCSAAEWQGNGSSPHTTHFHWNSKLGCSARRGGNHHSFPARQELLAPSPCLSAQGSSCGRLQPARSKGLLWPGAGMIPASSCCRRFSHDHPICCWPVAAVTIVLRDNELQAVKSHSLEGLTVPCPRRGSRWGPAAQPGRGHVPFVPPETQAAEASKSDRANGSDLCCSDWNRDLSCNEILSIEERAFEPLPFLKFLLCAGHPSCGGKCSCSFPHAAEVNADGWMATPGDRPQRACPHAAIRAASSWSLGCIATTTEKAAVSSRFHLGFAPFLPRDPALPPPSVGQARFLCVTSSFPRNLSGNGLTRIRSGTFQAWHGMHGTRAKGPPGRVSAGSLPMCSCQGPFSGPAHLLQGALESGQAVPTCPAHAAHILAICPDRALLFLRILSHNPLAVIADAAFFKLPSESSTSARANLPLAQPESAGDTTTPAPAEQGKGQAVLVCPQLQSNPATGTQTFRHESPSGPQGSGNKVHSCQQLQAPASFRDSGALRGEQQESRERGNPFWWHLIALLIPTGWFRAGRGRGKPGSRMASLGAGRSGSLCQQHHQHQGPAPSALGAEFWQPLSNACRDLSATQVTPATLLLLLQSTCVRLSPSHQQAPSAGTRALPGKKICVPQNQNKPSKLKSCCSLWERAKTHQLRGGISPFGEAQPPCVECMRSLSGALMESRTGWPGAPAISPLVFSQVPKEAACCLCQELPRPESPCRTIQFLCQKLCSTSAPQCGWSQTATAPEPGEMLQHCPVLQGGPDLPLEYRPWTKHLGMGTRWAHQTYDFPIHSMPPGKESGKAPCPSLVLEGNPGGFCATPLATAGQRAGPVMRSAGTEGDVSSLDSSRKNSYPPQHLLGHEVQTSVDDLRAKLKKKVHKAESIRTVESIVPHQPQPAWLKHVVEKTPSTWDHKQHESHLNRQAINPWAEDPRATATKDEQRLNRNLDFLSDPVVQRRPAVSSRGGATAEEEHSSIDRHLLITPDTIDTHWKQQEEGSRFLNRPWSPQSLDLAPVPGELLETMVDHKSLQTFMAHMERALRMDCSVPQLKLVCAKMVSETGLLLKTQGASDGMGRCPLQENIYRRTALEEDQETTEKVGELQALLHLECPGDEPHVPLQMPLHMLGTKACTAPSSAGSSLPGRSLPCLLSQLSPALLCSPAFSHTAMRLGALEFLQRGTGN
ncbi:hypothetical protein DV515_00016383, partial [Chloebia gouldiae]